MKRSLAALKWRQIILLGLAAAGIGGALVLRRMSDANDPRIEGVRALIRRVAGDKEGPMHPLTVRLVEQPLAPGEVFDAVNFFSQPSPFLKPVITGLPKNAVGTLEGPVWKWDKPVVQYRAATALPWRDYNGQPPFITIPARQLPNGDPWGFGRLPAPGCWKASVRGTVEFYNANTGEVWHGDASHDIVKVITAADIQRATDRQKAQFQLQAAQTKSQMVQPGKTYIAKLQWSAGGAERWRDVPQPGQPGFPLPALAGEVIGLKAVKADPRQPWPSEPDFKPAWNQDGRIIGGEQVWVQVGGKRDQDGLCTITAECGNTVAAKYRIVESLPYTVKVSCARRRVATVTPVIAQVAHSGRGVEPDLRVQFVAMLADGAAADEVASLAASAPTTAEVDAAGKAVTTLTPTGKTGQVRIGAIVLGPDGAPVAQTEKSDEVVLIIAP